MITPNLYGNIVANVVAGLTGGPGIMPGANVGNHVAVFEQGARHVGQDVSSSLSQTDLRSGSFLASQGSCLSHWGSKSRYLKSCSAKFWQGICPSDIIHPMSGIDRVSTPELCIMLQQPSLPPGSTLIQTFAMK